MWRVIICLTLLLSAALPQPALSYQTGADDKLSELNTLEKKYFEHSYDSDDVTQRVSRLEKLIYGDVRQGAPSQRLARIVALVSKEGEGGGPAEQETSVRPDRSSRDDETADPEEIAGNDANYSNYPHITALEKEILGRSHESEALPARLSRLEQAAFGNTRANQNLSARTDALEQYAESTLHRKPFGINPQMSDPPSPVYPNETMPAQQQNNSIDSAEVFADDPPPASAKMLVRTAWCEYHLTGRTYPQLHLIARLRQLHDQLFPTKTESNMQLLDDMDLFTQAVQQRMRQQRH